MFYRNSYETINGRDDPERVAEVTAWKPEKAGLGDHYGKYESVQVVDGFGLPDPDRDMTVRLTKMLGSTIDLPISADDDATRRASACGPTRITATRSKPRKTHLRRPMRCSTRSRAKP